MQQAPQTTAAMEELFLGASSSECKPTPSPIGAPVTLSVIIPSILSIYAASFVLVAYLQVPRRGRSYHFVLWISLTDYLLATQQVLARTFAEWDQSLYFSVMCWFRGSYQYLASARICWSCCLAIYLLLAVCTNKKNPGGTFVMIGFHLLSWVVPVGFLLAVVLLNPDDGSASDSSGSSSWYAGFNCLMPEDVEYTWIWGGFIVGAFALNLLSYLVVMVKYLATFRNCWERHRTKTALAIPIPLLVSLYLFTFVLCWSTNVIQVAIRFADHGQICWDPTRQIVINSLEYSLGVFDAAIYYITSKNLRGRFKRKTLILMFIFSPFLVIPTLVFRGLHRLARRGWWCMGSCYRKIRKRTSEPASIRAMPVRCSRERSIDQKLVAFLTAHDDASNLHSGRLLRTVSGAEFAETVVTKYPQKAPVAGYDGLVYKATEESLPFRSSFHRPPTRVEPRERSRDHNITDDDLIDVIDDVEQRTEDDVSDLEDNDSYQLGEEAEETEGLLAYGSLAYSTSNNHDESG